MRGFIMKFKFISVISVTALIIVFMIGCMDLDVRNLNAPDAEGALVDVEGVEGLIAGSYRTYYDAMHWNSWGFPSNTLDAMGLISTGDVGNFGIRELTEIPRVDLNNSTTWAYALDVLEGPWFGTYGAISAANDGIFAVEIGAFDDPGMEARKTRAHAFSKLVQGLGHSWLALYYDQAFIFTHDVDLDAIAAGESDMEMVPYTEVYAAAVEMLEEAITIAQTGTTFAALPYSWMRSDGINNARIVEIANTALARLHASIGRTPAERDAAPWGAIENHARNGVQETWYVDTAFPAWYDAYRIIGSLPRWSRANYHTLGLADQSGRYQDWLDTPHNDRWPFVIETDDRRIAGADSATAPGKYFAYTTPYQFLLDRGTYRFSGYPFTRWWNEYEFADFGAEGPLPHFAMAENCFLLAEALFRNDPNGNREEIVEIINRYRVEIGELPPATVDLSDDEIWEMIKYEKRLETYQTHPGIAWYDSRGWSGTNRGNDTNDSDLFIGTLVHFPVPAQELELWELDRYTFGPTQGGAATKASPFIAPH